MSDKKKYEVTSPIHLDKRYEIGSTILLTDEDAGPLLAAKGIKAPEPKAKAEHDENESKGEKKK